MLKHGLTVTVIHLLPLINKKRTVGALTKASAIILLLIFSFGIFYLISAQREYLKAAKTAKTVQTEFTDEDSDANDCSEQNELHIDWIGLKNLNPDVIAWIDIPGTEISCPILQSRDNSKYLRLNIYRKPSKTGSIFTDSRNKTPFADFNTIIHGHNLQNRSIMFSNLKKYRNKAFAEEHKAVYIYLPDGSCLEYTVFAFLKVNINNTFVYSTDISDKSSFLNSTSENNLLNTDTDLSLISSVITLSTCTNKNPDERFVVLAGRINN